MPVKSVEKARASALEKGHSTYVSERPCKLCAERGKDEFLRYVSQGQCVVCAHANSKSQQILKRKMRLAAQKLDREQNEIAVLILRRDRYGLNSQSFQESDRHHLAYLLKKHKKKSASVGPNSQPNPWD